MMKVDEISKLAIIGAGLMGHGIAQEFALAGYQVRIHDVTEEKLRQAAKNIQANLQTLVEIGRITRNQAQSVLPRIYSSTDLEEVVSEADVAIEAVFENLGLRR